MSVTTSWWEDAVQRSDCKDFFIASYAHTAAMCPCLQSTRLARRADACFRKLALWPLTFGFAGFGVVCLLLPLPAQPLREHLMVLALHLPLHLLATCKPRLLGTPLSETRQRSSYPQNSQQTIPGLKRER